MTRVVLEYSKPVIGSVYMMTSPDSAITIRIGAAKIVE